VYHLKKEIKNKEFEIYFVNDLHIGLKGFREKDFIKNVRDPILKGKNKYWIGLGDYIEGRSPSHKFYDAAARDVDVNDQLKKMSDLLKPIAPKCLGMVIGNHERSVLRETTIDIVMNFCCNNNIPYAGNVGLLDISNGRGQVKSLLFAHGSGGGVTKGGPLNKAVNYTQYWDADMYFQGHSHSLSSAVVDKHERDSNNAPTFRATHVTVCGSFLSGYPNGSNSYEETMNLPPNGIGFVKVSFDSELEPEIHIKAINVSK